MSDEAQRDTGIVLLILNLGARRGGWSAPRSGRVISGKEPRYPLYRRSSGPQGNSGREWRREETLMRTGVRTPDVRVVASRYTD